MRGNEAKIEVTFDGQVGGKAAADELAWDVLAGITGAEQVTVTTVGATVTWKTKDGGGVEEI